MQIIQPLPRESRSPTLASCNGAIECERLNSIWSVQSAFLRARLTRVLAEIEHSVHALYRLFINNQTLN